MVARSDHCALSPSLPHQAADPRIDSSLSPVLTQSLAPEGLRENERNRGDQSVTTCFPSPRLAREEDLGLLWEEHPVAHTSCLTKAH